MEFEEFSRELAKEFKKIKIELNSYQIQTFFTFMKEMLKENENVNLTAITEPKEIILKHFVDSATIKKYIKTNSKLIDVGTGAGFPGIPIKILDKTLDIVLLDSLNKRVDFLKRISEKLKFEKIKAIHMRAEEAGQDKVLRENFDIAVSRAVAPLNVLLEYMLPFVKVGGECICMKGSEIEEELKQSEKVIRLLGGKIEKVEEFYLTENENKRNIIVIKKEKETPLKFPRRAGTPKKDPL